MSSNNEKPIDHRIEIVFLYDVRDANPNGDPDTGNMPRIDDNTGENIVTDVRLKRTIRDYWLSKGKEILVRAVENEDGNRQNMEDRVSSELAIKKEEIDQPSKLRAKLTMDVPKKFIDIRSFGAAITYKGANTSITGPVQFGLGRSLNIPKVSTRTITTSLSSKSDKGAGSIGEYHIIDYSLIRFHGIISEVSAKKTLFSESDKIEIFKGLWHGTESINTRSKFNHMPRLMIIVYSKPGCSQIGDLDISIKIDGSRDIHTFEEVKLDCKELKTRLTNFNNQIEKIEYRCDPNLKFVMDGKSVKIEDILGKNAVERKD